MLAPNVTAATSAATATAELAITERTRARCAGATENRVPTAIATGRSCGVERPAEARHPGDVLVSQRSPGRLRATR